MFIVDFSEEFRDSQAVIETLKDQSWLNHSRIDYVIVEKAWRRYTWRSFDTKADPLPPGHVINLTYLDTFGLSRPKIDRDQSRAPLLRPKNSFLNAPKNILTPSLSLYSPADNSLSSTISQTILNNLKIMYAKRYQHSDERNQIHKKERKSRNYVYDNYI